MEKTFEVLFTETAYETFDIIVDQIRLKWGQSVADKFERKAIRTI